MQIGKSWFGVFRSQFSGFLPETNDSKYAFKIQIKPFFNPQYCYAETKQDASAFHLGQKAKL